MTIDDAKQGIKVKKIINNTARIRCSNRIF